MRLLAFVVLAASAAYAAEPVEYVCPFVDEGPETDGTLDEPAWTAAPAPPAFTEMGLSTAEAKDPTGVRMLAGPEALYLGLDMTSAPGQPPTAVERERDGKTFNDDSFELFLCTDPGEGRWYRLCMNAAGSIADSLSDPGLMPEERVAWNPEWRHAAVSREGGWSAEAAIPWAAFGLEGRPARGQVWRVRIGRTAEHFPNSMWPANATGSFHNQSVFAYLIFGDRNLLVNGGFEGEVDENGRPAGWSYSYKPTHGDGKIELSRENAQAGEQCIRYEKSDAIKWYPQLHSQPVPAQPNSVYEYSALVNCPVQFVMRWRLIGPESVKRSTVQPPTDGWERCTVEIEVGSGVEAISVGIQLSGLQGVIWADDVRLVRRNDIQLSPVTLPVPHRYHALEELAARTRFKPYALLQREDGGFGPDRVIFHDTGSGAEIWMLTRSADGKSTRHFYMEASPWNADGSLLCFFTGQLGKGTVLMPADGSSWHRTPDYYSGYIWDRLDPDRLYWRKYKAPQQYDLAVADLSTHESGVIREFEGSLGLWPMSPDGKYLLVKNTVPDPGNDHDITSLIWLIERDGKEAIKLEPGHQIHQLWFSKRPDYSVEFNYEWADETGRQGAYMMWPDGTLRQVSKKHWSHRAHSPDGEWVTAGGPARIIRWDGSEIRPIASVGTTHNSWRTDTRWWAASSSRYLVRIAADGRDFVQRLGANNSALDKSTYWTEAHPQMSADGTKLAYASNMLHDIEFYNLIMMLPGAPQELTAEPQGGKLQLAWEPPKYHKEIKGYLVYRSDASGQPGEQITPEPVAATTFAAEGAEGGPWCYTVTAIEHSGLEGMPSAEVCSDPSWPGEVCHYFEAERGRYAKPANEIFAPHASGLYGLTLGDPVPAEEGVTVPVRAARDGQWLIHLRASGRLADGSVAVSVDGEAVGTCAVGKTDWAWAPVVGEANAPAAIALRAGEHQLTLVGSAGGISLDKLCLTSDPRLRPANLGGMDATPPRAVAGLTAEAEGKYAIRLSWQAVVEADLAHYNVYCGRSADYELGNERLVGSPSEAHFVDWGLKPGSEYFYRVTAVDRRGNEGEPSAAVAATTEPLEPRLFLELERGWNWNEAEEVVLPFEMPADGEFVIWGKLQSLDGQRKVSVEINLDGERVATRRLDLDYICTGHGGPVLNTWLWDCLRPGVTAPGDPMAFAVAAGAHELTLKRAGKGFVEFERFVITNDLGHEPPGTTSFLIKQEKEK